MLTTIINILIRIFSNSFSNVFQKILTKQGERSSSVNLLTYLGLSIIAVLFIHNIHINIDIIKNIIFMGLFGAAGNYFIIKALSVGELSIIAPINSYKPVVAMFFAMVYLHEIPSLISILGLILIILGTFILTGRGGIYNKALAFRGLALIFSGIEAVFIKKIILLSDIQTAFYFWAIMGLFFAIVFLLISGQKLKIKTSNIKYQILLVLLTATMQYSTNYVFSKMNVSYALALFQLSILLSIFLGAGLFKERGIIPKTTAALIMIFGAILIILS